MIESVETSSAPRSPSLPGRVAAWVGRNMAPHLGAIAFIVAAIILQVITLLVGQQTSKPSLASITLQTLTLLSGSAGSYIFGRSSARDAAKEIVRPHARASFRRAASLYKALHRQRQTLSVVHKGLTDEAKTIEGGTPVVDLSVARWAIIGVQNLVIEQIGTAADALEDWKDLVPEEVASFARQLSDDVEGFDL